MLPVKDQIGRARLIKPSSASLGFLRSWPPRTEKPARRPYLLNHLSLGITMCRRGCVQERIRTMPGTCPEEPRVASSILDRRRSVALP
jgi:hypothetical protein